MLLWEHRFKKQDQIRVKYLSIHLRYIVSMNLTSHIEMFSSKYFSEFFSYFVKLYSKTKVWNTSKHVKHNTPGCTFAHVPFPPHIYLLTRKYFQRFIHSSVNIKRENKGILKKNKWCDESKRKQQNWGKRHKGMKCGWILSKANLQQLSSLMGSLFACLLYVTRAVFLALHIKEESLGK